MTQISLSELKANAGKYVGLVDQQDILITKNGKVVAKLVTAKADKKMAFSNLMSIFGGVSLNDQDVDNIREERLR